jgi:hypothetical protein
MTDAPLLRPPSEGKIRAVPGMENKQASGNACWSTGSREDVRSMQEMRRGECRDMQLGSYVPARLKAGRTAPPATPVHQAAVDEEGRRGGHPESSPLVHVLLHRRAAGANTALRLAFSPSMRMRRRLHRSWARVPHEAESPAPHGDWRWYPLCAPRWLICRCSTERAGSGNAFFPRILAGPGRL